MKITDLDAGTKLEFELFDVEGKKNGPLLKSEFEWAESDKTVFVAAPIHEGYYFLIPSGTTMNVYFNHKDDFYRTSAVIINKSVKNNMSLYKIEITGDYERIQRRQFFRFDCLLPIKFRQIKDDEIQTMSKTPFVEGITRDLSGGGLCIAVRNKVDPDMLFECALQLPEGDYVSFIGKAIRISDLNIKGIYSCEVGIEFTKIDNKCREAIIGYIFREQRKLRKKGLV